MCESPAEAPGRRAGRDLLTRTAALRWFLGGEDGADTNADEVLEYRAASVVLDEIEQRYRGLRAVLNAVERAGVVAAGLRLARAAGGPAPVIAALEEMLGRERAAVARLMAHMAAPEPERLLASYARLAAFASAIEEA